MRIKKIKINRAPVLTLWATVFVKRMGYDHESALTLGKAVAGLNAQSKGQLGIFEEQKGLKEGRKSRAKRRRNKGRTRPQLYSLTCQMKRNAHYNLKKNGQEGSRTLTGAMPSGF